MFLRNRSYEMRRNQAKTRMQIVRRKKVTKLLKKIFKEVVRYVSHYMKRYSYSTLSRCCYVNTISYQQ